MANVSSKNKRNSLDASFVRDVSLDTSLMSDDIKGKVALISKIDKIIRDEYSDLGIAATTDVSARDVLKEKLSQNYSKVYGNDDVILDELLEETVGLGVIERFIRNPDVTDITFNGTDLIVETNGNKQINDTHGFVDSDYINRLATKYASALGSGKDFQESKPILDAVVGNMRVNFVHESSAQAGTTMAIRVSHTKLVVTRSSIALMAPAYVGELLLGFVRAQTNIVMSGRTGTGKTEATKYMISEIPFREKIALIEDVAEMHAKVLFPDADIHSWVQTAKAPATALLKASLRNNPEWVIVTELRTGEEAVEWMEAIKSDHRSITSLHAASAKNIPNRINGMYSEVRNVDEARFEENVRGLLNIGVQLEARIINNRKVRFISEVMEFRPEDEGGNIMIFKQRMRKDGSREYSFGPMSEEMRDRLDDNNASIPLYDKQYAEFMIDSSVTEVEKFKAETVEKLALEPDGESKELLSKKLKLEYNVLIKRLQKVITENQALRSKAMVEYIDKLGVEETKVLARISDCHRDLSKAKDQQSREKAELELVLAEKDLELVKADIQNMKSEQPNIYSGKVL